jgi:transcriptional regulator
MYIPKYFEVTETEEILAFIKANSFGQLISYVEGRLFSSHLPFLISDGGGSLICHLAKNNPQWESIVKQEVLATFQGPHDYISPSWYCSSVVTTWNYQAVHVYGRAKIITDHEELRKIVNDLTQRHESSFQNPWCSEYKESLLQAIIGIEIEVSEIQAKYKLSQNRLENDRKQLIKKLESVGAVLLAEAMKNEL